MTNSHLSFEAHLHKNVKHDISFQLLSEDSEKFQNLVQETLRRHVKAINKLSDSAGQWHSGPFMINIAVLTSLVGLAQLFLLGPNQELVCQCL